MENLFGVPTEHPVVPLFFVPPCRWGPRRAPTIDILSAKLGKAGLLLRLPSFLGRHVTVEESLPVGALLKNGEAHPDFTNGGPVDRLIAATGTQDEAGLGVGQLRVVLHTHRVERDTDDQHVILSDGVHGGTRGNGLLQLGLVSHGDTFQL